jgi:hypothetical protein
VRFYLDSLSIEHAEVERYQLGALDLNAALGSTVRIRFTGRKACTACGREVKKLFAEGYCYPCFTTLAAADTCIVRPHTCHFARGTCREPAWGKAHCLIPHVVYLALTSGVKVGVTGAHKTLKRWADQGALEAVVLARTPDRLTAGMIEHALSRHLADRTNWRKLLTGEPAPVDLAAARRDAHALVPESLRGHCTDDTPSTSLRYPIRRYLAKARSVNAEREPVVSGILEGLRGQYLLLSDRALNVRRYAGWEIELDVL